LTNKRATRPVLAPRPPAPPDANALELLARIVAAGSFAQAARELGLTRAAVSRRVASIEAQLGTPLFARSTRALGLTEAGRRLAARARTVLEAAEAARRGLRSSAAEGDTLSGTLRVASVPSFGQSLLGPLLARFQAQHPALHVELHMSNRRVDLLRDGIDVAFRITDKPPPDSVAQVLLPFKVGAYAAPLAGVPLPGPEALAHNRCLVFSPPTDEVSLAWHHAATARVVTVVVEPAMVGDDAGTLQAAARAGGGVLFAPDFAVAEDLARGALVDALPGWHLPVTVGSAIQALTLPLAEAPASARALVRYARDALGGSAAPAGTSSR
jgi:DNA-binding transcriptional LysR family regulator